ncbi:MAG: hypothetical protein KDD43_07750 [Bdellovibrionales bacterium]|nr:hypothetical protein [Bdellovibrionales bacterium]
MSFEDAFHVVHSFFTTKPAAKDALRHLKRGHEIRLLIDGRTECALFFEAGQVAFEQRPCPKADVEFSIGPEAIRLLSTHSGESVAQLGVDIVKEIIAGNVKLRVCGSILRILSGGYLAIITSGGPEFMGYLASHGLTSLGKITSLIRSLKK